MQYNVNYSCISHIGNARTSNQDNFFCGGYEAKTLPNADLKQFSGILDTARFPLVGIFDGMGGEECGDVAAQIAAATAGSYTIDNNPEASLVQLCLKANDRIHSYSIEHQIRTMGTTAAMLLFTEKRIIICNIGDSRIYRFTGHELEQLSKDHILAAPFGVKPPLSQYLGMAPDEALIEPYISNVKYRNGDILLLCSDGLTDTVSNEEIAVILSSFRFEEIGCQLLMKALENNHTDNITIIVCRIDQNGRNRFLKNIIFRKSGG